jgi:hypothetical protein
MPSAKPRKLVENWESVRDEWVQAVEQLVDEAEAWASERQWFVHRDCKTITEDGVGSYEVPVLMMRAPAGRLILEPLSRFVGKATGLVDLSVFPSYDRRSIVRTEKGWQFVKVGARNQYRRWSKTAFIEVATELAANA